MFALRLEGGYRGRMVGVDYSRQSVELARKLARQYVAATTDHDLSGTASTEDMISFEVLDLIHDTPDEQPWWPDAAAGGGFDLVLDKGTFDAISLSSATVYDPSINKERRICEVYPAKVLGMVRTGGFLLVTSCNWTEDEVVAWFTNADANAQTNGQTQTPTETETQTQTQMQTQTGSTAATARFEVYDRIRYPVFEFGGQKGQGVASVCFRKTAAATTQ